MGIRATDTKAKIEIPQGMPTFSSNGRMKSEKAPAKTDRRNVFAATALAEYL